MTESPFETRSSEVAWECNWFSIRKDALLLPDGSAGEYNVVQRGESVYVVATTHNNQMVLIRNYRYTVDQWLWEVPAGNIESGHDELSTARVELLEEVGGKSTSIRKIGSFFVQPGVSDEVSHIFLATGVTLGKPHREPTEVMETHLFPINKVIEMIHNGTLNDGPSITSIMRCIPHISGS